MNENSFHLKKGFTMLEILAVLGISALLLLFTTAPLMSYYQRVVFQGVTENVMTMLDEARKSTLSSFKSSQYGVYFTATSTTLFSGTTYTPGAPDNDIYVLDSGVEITGINLNGGGDELVFKRISGETEEYGTIEVSSLRGSTSPRIITIYETGLVEID